MEQERRAGHQDLLMDLLQRTTRIEERGVARDAEIKELRADIGVIKQHLGTLVSEIAQAKAVGRASTGLLGVLLKLLPLGAAGAGLGWLAALFHGSR